MTLELEMDCNTNYNRTIVLTIRKIQNVSDKSGMSMEARNLPLRRLNLDLGSLSIRNSVIRVAPGPMHLQLPAQPRDILPSWTILLLLRCMPTLRPRYRGRQPARVRLSVLYSSINSCTPIHAILHFSVGLSVSDRASSFQSRVSVSCRQRCCTDMLNPRCGARRLDSHGFAAR